MNEYRLSLPPLGSRAPDFEAETTFGPIKMSDYEGQWLVFFSHPADFTPVCTSEFISFTQYESSFRQRNTKLLGLSVDSNTSHLGWVYDISRFLGITIPFPIIADIRMEISTLYGMITPTNSSSSVRAVFIIDDKQIIRLILFYPNEVGR